MLGGRIREVKEEAPPAPGDMSGAGHPASAAPPQHTEHPESIVGYNRGLRCFLQHSWVTATLLGEVRLSRQGRLFEIYGVLMARVCDVTGKGPMVGNNVSHANNKTKRRFLPNLQYRRFWVEAENRWVRLRVSGAALRLIDKNGIDAVLADLRARGQA